MDRRDRIPRIEGMIDPVSLHDAAAKTASQRPAITQAANVPLSVSWPNYDDIVLIEVAHGH